MLFLCIVFDGKFFPMVDLIWIYCSKLTIFSLAPDSVTMYLKKVSTFYLCTEMWEYNFRYWIPTKQQFVNNLYGKHSNFKST